MGAKKILLLFSFMGCCLFDDVLSFELLSILFSDNFELNFRRIRTAFTLRKGELVSLYWINLWLEVRFEFLLPSVVELVIIAISQRELPNDVFEIKLEFSFSDLQVRIFRGKHFQESLGRHLFLIKLFEQVVKS